MQTWAYFYLKRTIRALISNNNNGKKIKITFPFIKISNYYHSIIENYEKIADFARIQLPWCMVSSVV